MGLPRGTALPRLMCWLGCPGATLAYVSLPFSQLCITCLVYAKKHWTVKMTQQAFTLSSGSICVLPHGAACHPVCMLVAAMSSKKC